MIRRRAGRSLPRHDGRGSGGFAAHARGLSQRSRARGREHADRLARRRSTMCRDLGAQWSELAPSTVARRSAALRRFFGFLVDDGLRKDDPSAALPRPRLERPLPRILDDGRNRADVRGGRGSRGERRTGGACAISHCSSCSTAPGLRASELVSLPRGAVRPGQPFLMVRGKGSKERLVPISSRAAGCGRAMARDRARRDAVAVPERQDRTSAECGCSRSSGRWPRMPESRPSGSARTCSATPSRRICCRAARTCACCSRCSAMPTSRPRKSTRMSTVPGWSSWSTPAIRSRPRGR